MNEEKQAAIAPDLDFLRDNAELLGFALRASGVPLSTNDVAKGINLCRVQVYNKKTNQLQRRWIEGDGRIIRLDHASQTFWTFFPLGIAPKKKTGDPYQPKFIYRVTVRHMGSHADAHYLCDRFLEVGRDGTIIKNEHVDGNQVPRVDMPKRMLAKINGVLWDYFLADLYKFSFYPFWDESKDGHVTYLGIDHTKGEVNSDYRAQLDKLIQSRYGNAALLLLAYSAFSILQPFFLKYRTAASETSYSAVHAALDSQVSLCVVDQQSSLPGVNTWLTELCCGQERTPDGKALSGIHILTAKEGQEGRRITRSEFEREVLRCDYPLWVNRTVDEELLRSYSILPVFIQKTDRPIDSLQPFFDELLHDFIFAIESEKLNANLQISSRVWEKSQNILKQMAVEIQKADELGISRQRGGTCWIFPTAKQNESPVGLRSSGDLIPLSKRYGPRLRRLKAIVLKLLLSMEER